MAKTCKICASKFTPRVHNQGLSEHQFNQMLIDQNGQCAICSKSHIDCPNGLYVDHDHETNRVRQLLCRDCNVGIGHFKESPELLGKAIEYLRRHETTLSLVKGDT